MTKSESSDVTEKNIQKIIDDYEKNATILSKKMFNAPPGTARIGMWQVGQEKHLLIGKFILHKLQVKILRRLPVHLIRELLVVEFELDGLYYWALTNDIFESRAGQKIFKQWSLKEAFRTLMAAIFSSLFVSAHNPAIERLNRATNDAVSDAVKNLVSNKQTVLM